MMQRTLAAIQDKFFDNPSLLQHDISKVDYAVSVHLPPVESQSFESELSAMLCRMICAGLQFQLEQVDRKLFILVHCPMSTLHSEYYQSRVEDWLKGVGDAEFDAATEMLQEKARALPPSERLRLIAQILERLVPAEETDFKVKMFPLHDPVFNSAWLKNWSTKWLLTLDDLNVTRNHFGEDIALYFDFLQSYFLALLVPSVSGVIAYLLGVKYSPWFSGITCAWSLCFIAYWERREKELVGGWNVRGCSKNDPVRAQFKEDSMVTDKVTGRQTKFYPAYKRWLRRAVTMPIILVMAVALTAYIGLMYMLEMVLMEFYVGYGKDYLLYLPTVIYTLSIPYICEYYANISQWLNGYENYETQNAYSWNLVEKLFISNCLVSYMYLLMNGLIYIPFGHDIAMSFGAYFEVPVNVPTKSSQDRFLAGVQDFIILGQLLNAFGELAWPVMLRNLKLLTSGKKSADEDADASKNSQVKETMRTVVEQSELSVYELDEDFGEMVIQFGCVVLFNGVWSLCALASFVNNWLEVRSDALKISMNSQRPIPKRVESIGPWLANLKFLAWFGLILNVQWIYMFHESEILSSISEVTASWSTKPLFFYMLVAEHLFMALWFILNQVSSSLGSEADVRASHQEFQLKQKYLAVVQENGGYEFAHLTEMLPPGEHDDDDTHPLSKLTKNKWQSITFADVKDQEREILQLCQTSVKKLQLGAAADKKDK